MLRSLIITKQHNKITGDVTKYFTKDLPLQTKMNKYSVGLLKNKRLDSEYKKLSNESWISEIKIIDQTNWQIEFIKIRNNTIRIQLIFSNYPLSPPVIKMLSNNLFAEIENGLVDKNNTIKIDLTNPSNWKITNNLTEICLYLYNCFNNSLK